MKKILDNQIAFYQSPDGSVNIEVLFVEENIWLTQKKMAELFNTTTQNITQHLGNIYSERELDKKSTCKDFLLVQTEGTRKVKRNFTMYSLEAIIAVRYRVNSECGTQFRQWATKTFKEYYMKLITHLQFIDKMLTNNLLLCVFKVAKNTRSALHSGFCYF